MPPQTERKQESCGEAEGTGPPTHRKRFPSQGCATSVGHARSPLYRQALHSGIVESHVCQNSSVSHGSESSSSKSQRTGKLESKTLKPDLRMKPAGLSLKEETLHMAGMEV